MCAALKQPRNGKIVVDVRDIDSTLDCSNIVQKLLEYVLVNKRVVPYPISYLERVSRNTPDSGNTSEKDIIKEEIHVKRAQMFYSKLTHISQCLQKEFIGGSWKNVRIVAFILGPTINCPKEIYLIKIPDSLDDSCTKNEKFDQMSYVVLNRDMSTFMSAYVAPTNVYVMVLKPEEEDSSWALPMPIYKLTSRSPIAVIQLHRNQIKPKYFKVRPDCPEVEKLIEDLSKLEIFPHNIENDRMLRHTERLAPVSLQELSDTLHGISGTSILSPPCPLQDLLNLGVCESDKSIDLKRHTSASGSETDDSSICSPASSQKCDEIEIKDMNAPNVEQNTEPVQQNKLIWYLYTECLTSFKEPARRNSRHVAKKLNNVT